MKKELRKRENRGQKNLQLYRCTCDSCGGCGSGGGAKDYYKVEGGQSNYRAAWVDV